jgi:DNA-binding NtrC family response regulator
MPLVLVVDDEPGVQESLRMLLKEECQVVTAGNAAEALLAVEQTPPDLVLLDLVMPGRSGLDLLSDLSERGVPAPVIVLTATKTVTTAVEAMKRGAADYVTKPFEVDALRIKIRRLLEQGALEQEVARLRDEVSRRDRLGAMVGRSAPMQELFRAIERVARSKASVLIRGESGTGKELVARALHDLGPRSDGPFVAVNCAAIPETLLESELFGHERGAFTDAREQRIGRFEAAGGGTLFLDEVGEIAPAMQGKLLRALQERVIERLGGAHPIPVDVRIVAATNRDLEASIQAGEFRSDLYYRINVVPLAIPPLRQRREDIALLAEHVLARISTEAGRGKMSLAPEAAELFQSYAWPGNVRELENAIERAAALSDRDELQAADLPEVVVEGARMATLGEQVRAGRLGFDEAVARFESELLREALESSGWNQTQAAAQLGITRRQLKLKIDRYQLGGPGTNPSS